jgi:hypothetical protein
VVGFWIASVFVQLARLERWLPEFLFLCEQRQMIRADLLAMAVDVGNEQGASDTLGQPAARDCVERCEARGMHLMGEVVEMEQQPVPDTSHRETDVPKAWEQALEMREEMIEELLGG